MSKPGVSVVIPVYNHEKYIDATLASVLAQTLPPTEIIVIDDGSRDRSWERVQRLARDARIKAWTRPNRGAHLTINEAISHASGEYVAILNSDDCYVPDRLAICFDALEKNRTAAAVCTAIDFMDGNGATRRNKWYEQAVAFYRQTDDLSLALMNGNFLMTTSNLFVRRRAFADVGFFANLRYAHDLDFFLRLAGERDQILWLDAPLLRYRIHDTNTIGEDALKVKIEWAAVVASFLWRTGKHRDWTYLSRMAAIADQHNLSRLLFFFFLQFQRADAGAPTADVYLDDPAFLEFIAGAVR